MKNFLRLLLCACFAILGVNGLFAQNSVAVTAFYDVEGDGINDNIYIVPGLTTGELFLTQVGTGTVFNHDNEAGGAGLYTFDMGGAGLPDGDYFLTYTETPWTMANTVGGNEVYAITLLNVGGATDDNDVDPISGISATFNLTGSATEMDIDLGLYAVGAVGDFIWEDLNGDGLQDAGEPGLVGVSVTLLDGTGAPAVDTDGIPVPATVSDGAGMYVFGNLPPDDYIVQFNLPTEGGLNWVATEFNPGIFSNDSDADPNNGLQSPVNTNYDAGAGTYTLFMDNIDAGFFVPVIIGDKVFCDENGNGIDDDGAAGVDNIMVRLIDNNTGAQALGTDNVTPIPDQITAGGGMYQFIDVPPGDYIVEFGPLAPPFVFTIMDAPGSDDTDSDVNVANGRTDVFSVDSRDMDEETRVDAGVYQTFILTGNIWVESDMNNSYDGEPGPGGVNLTLFNADTGGQAGNTVSNAGIYEFTDLPPGNYTLQINADAFVQGAPLNGASPCPGNGDANSMVDNDDDGMDGQPAMTTTFTLLSNCDPANPPVVEYIDFCYFFDCAQENDLASTSCEGIADIDIICDISILGNFCNIMPTQDSPDNTLQPLCDDGGFPHNISWFAFVAYGGSYSVTVTPTGCSGSTTGVDGVQIGLYTDCTYSESVYCNPECNLAPVTFDSDLLTEGQTYYFFIDGCSSSVCSYEVTIDGAPLPPNLTPDDVCIDNNGTLECDDVTYCPDTDVLFTATGLDLTVDFTWTVSAISGGPYDGDPNPITPEDEIAVSFANEGVYEVCVTNISNGCPGLAWNGLICRQVTIEGIDDEMFDEQTICQEDLATFDIGVFASDDPNADGTPGWQAPPGFDFGTNTGIVTTPEGCMYEQEFELMSYPVTPPEDVVIFVCNYDLPIDVGGVMITEGSFAGNLDFELDNVLLTGISDVNGCDSIINIMATQLVILNGAIGDPICLPEGIILDFNYQEGLSTSADNIEFVWTGPMGEELTNNFTDPTDIIAPNASGDGTYTLTATVTQGGEMCEFVYTQEIVFSDFFPPNPTIEGPLNVCESSGVVVYTADDGDDAFAFTWTYPNDVASATLSGNASETLTIDWTGSDGGEVTVVGMNACGESEEVMFTVTVIPQIIPSFSLDTEVCADSMATITFTGSAGTIDSYTWDFDGGTVAGTGGVGPGPHPVSWPDAGEKTITLSVTDENGCVSAVETQTLNVIEPLTPPTVICNPATGEVTFTWDDVAGASSYDVNVLSGQSGTLTGNSFTVTGLADGETVNIELIVFTNDACMMVVGTAPGCTSQDCIAPTITLTPDVTSICLDGTTTPFDIVVDVTTGETGTGVFSGPGVDPATGVFDPSMADIGINNITYNFTTDDDCIGNAATQIEVFETPVASFDTDTDTICITEEFIATYDGTAGVTALTWDYGVDGSGPGGANPNITFTSEGLKTITLFVEKDGCESEVVTKEVLVQPELEAINVICDEQNLNSVVFGWNDIAGATGYEVTIGSDAPYVTTDLSALVDNLNPDDEVMITVVVLTDSKCPGSSFSQTCIAKACPSFDIAIDVPVVDYCVDGTNTPVTLDATATGGVGGGTFTWTGDNVTDNQFDPNGLAEGSYEIFVTYEEDGCDGSSSFMINLTTTPTAGFDVDNTTICVGETVNINYTGSQLSGQTINWTSGGEPISGSGTAFSGVFNDAGTFDIDLQVENGDCVSEIVTQTITVEEELVFDAPMCSPSLDQIVFNWTAVDCATDYEVFVDGVSQGTQTATTITVDGLSEGQEVMLEIVAISDCACGDVMQTITCEAMACPMVTIALSAAQTDFCSSDDLSPVEIIDEVMNSAGSGTATFSGPGVDADGMFDPAAAGNGTHVIDYLFVESEGCEYTESITFTVNEAPTVDLVAGEITCYDQETTNLQITTGGGDGSYTVTLDGNPTQMDTMLAPGTYDVLVTDGNMCTATASVTINGVSEPMPTIDGALELTTGESSTYSIQSGLFTGQAIDSIIWTANNVEVCNDPSCFSITQTPESGTTEYIVTVYYNNGCSVTTSVTVEATDPLPVSIVEIPNIISPNDDGQNDTWVIFSNDEEVVVNSVKIFDRWGNMVFQVTDQFIAAGNNVTWDGTFNDKSVQPGVYVYYIDFVQNGRPKIRSGDITVIQ